MSDSLRNDLFEVMKNCDFIDRKNQFKKGLLVNKQNKRLLIKQVYPKNSPVSVDVFMQYAHVVSVNGRFKFDPGVLLGFDMFNQMIYPVCYRNDLLDHSINVYMNGEMNEDNANWLLEYWSTWFNELIAGDYVEQAQLKAS